VFWAKLEELKKRLMKKDILRKVRAYVYVVEFQKRGLPHAHFLLIMQRAYKLTCPEQYDLISAELLDRKKYPELYKMVTKHMMHEPCGSLNPNCPLQRVELHARTVIPDLSTMLLRRARIHTLFIGVVMMGERRESEAMSWAISGSSHTTHTCCVHSTVT
jgi:hypothetical protein